MLKSEKTNRLDRRTLTIIIAATLAVQLFAAYATISKTGSSPSSIIAVDEFYFNRFKPLFRTEIIVFHSGYDAEFYYLAATDLFGRQTYRMSYFYKRIILPAAIHFATFGQQKYFPHAFFAISLLSTLAAAGFLAKYLAMRGASPYWAFAFSFFPGTIISTMHTGVDVLCLALLLPGIMLADEGRRAPDARFAAGLLCLTLAALTKETSIIFCAALAVIAFIRGNRAAAPLFFLPVAIYFAWSFSVDHYLMPITQYGSRDALTYNYTAMPFAGIAEWLRHELKGGTVSIRLMVENILAPAAFLIFAASTGIYAGLSRRKFDSSFFLFSLALAAMLPFCRPPLLNLFSCLRIFLPTFICFIIIAADFRPRTKLIVAILIAIAIATADAALLLKPPAPYFLYHPATTQVSNRSIDTEDADNMGSFAAIHRIMESPTA